MIFDPITIGLEATVADAKSHERNTRSEEFVTDKEGKLKGIVTSRICVSENDRKRKITEVMTTNLITTDLSIPILKLLQGYFRNIK